MKTKVIEPVSGRVELISSSGTIRIRIKDGHIDVYTPMGDHAASFSASMVESLIEKYNEMED